MQVSFSLISERKEEPRGFFFFLSLCLSMVWGTLAEGDLIMDIPELGAISLDEALG